MNRRSLLKLSGYFGAATAATQLGWLNAESQAAEPSSPASSSSPTLTMQLDWVFNVQFAGLLMADYLGLYKQRDLTVALKPWESGMIVPDVVAADPMAIGCSEQNLILAAQAQGAPIKAVATMFQASPYALMAMPDSNIQTLADLVGKKVGIHADGVKVMELVKSINGLKPGDIEVVEIPYENKLNRLIGGELAALQCYAVDEPIGFAKQVGQAPILLPMDQYGYKAYAQVFFASDALLQQQPEQVKAFLEASFAGWRIALANIPATAKLIAETYAEKDSKYTDVAYQQQSLQLVGEYVLRGIAANQIGTILPAQWQQATDLMAQYNIIADRPDPEKSLDLSFWSGVS
jgi:NitT/TauT family transport system substrate-binding protein